MEHMKQENMKFVPIQGFEQKPKVLFGIYNEQHLLYVTGNEVIADKQRAFDPDSRFIVRYDVCPEHAHLIEGGEGPDGG